MRQPCLVTPSSVVEKDLSCSGIQNGSLNELPGLELGEGKRHESCSDCIIHVLFSDCIIHVLGEGKWHESCSDCIIHVPIALEGTDSDGISCDMNSMTVLEGQASPDVCRSSGAEGTSEGTSVALS